MGPTSPLKNSTGSKMRLQEYKVGNYIANFIRLNKWLISSFRKLTIHYLFGVTCKRCGMKLAKLHS